MIEPALSLLVDGKVVLEAIVVTIEGNMMCYPCLEELTFKIIHMDIKPIYELIRLHILKMYESFITLCLENRNLIFIPLTQDKILILLVNKEYDAENIAQEYLKIISRVVRFKNERNMSMHYYRNKLNSSEVLNAERDPPSLIDKINKLILNNVISAAIVISNSGEILDQYGKIKLNGKVIETLLSLHKSIMKDLEYKIARLITNELDIILVPLGVKGEILLIAEIVRKLKTKEILERLI
ncbi:MAG: hypothetical protein B6U85_09130 [Desulfurococcales archaeon ex4484_42]|nr:MAG: hypothetical protein B6U85_09130 [Desulfurococcales archaeon ex4484_42]